MKDHGFAGVANRLRIADETHDVAPSGGRVFTIVAAVQCAHNLAEDAPDEFLLAHLVLVLQFADDAA